MILNIKEQVARVFSPVSYEEEMEHIFTTLLLPFLRLIPQSAVNFINTSITARSELASPYTLTRIAVN